MFKKILRFFSPDSIYVNGEIKLYRIRDGWNSWRVLYNHKVIRVYEDSSKYHVVGRRSIVTSNLLRKQDDVIINCEQFQGHLTLKNLREAFPEYFV